MTTGTRERGYRYIAATHRPVCGARAAGRLAQRSGHRGCDGQQGPTCLERYAIANARVNVNSRRYRIFRLEPRKPPQHLLRSERTSGIRSGEARPPACPHTTAPSFSGHSASGVAHVVTGRGRPHWLQACARPWRQAAPPGPPQEPRLNPRHISMPPACSSLGPVWRGSHRG